MESQQTLKPIRRLTCACCGSETRGRQWWNRDTGYGLCNGCINYCLERMGQEEFDQSYGKRGVHYDVQETA